MTELWWAVRETSPHRWRPEDGWDERAKAERSAAFYRRDRHRRAVVVFGSPDDGERFGPALQAAVAAMERGKR